MSDAIEQLLDQRLPQPGVAACGVRLEGRIVANRSFTGSLSAAQVEQSLTRLAAGAESLVEQGLGAQRLSWVFEHLRVLVAQRQDGAFLALFIENRPGVATDELEGVLKAFDELCPTSAKA
jgi:hypothetical protein